MPGCLLGRRLGAPPRALSSLHLPSAMVGFPPPPPALRSFTPSRHHFSCRLSLQHARSGRESRGLHSPSACGSACLAPGGVSCCGGRFELVGGLPASAGRGTPTALSAACPAPCLSPAGPWGRSWAAVCGTGCCHCPLLRNAQCLVIVAPERPAPQCPCACPPWRPPYEAAGLTLLWSELGATLPHACRPFLCCSLWVSSSWRHRPSTRGSCVFTLQ